MTYSHWQIARLRKRLTSYKLHRKRTWEKIATDMLYCDSMPEAYVEQEDVRPLSESLRRFTSMIQEPHEERLNAIRLYLQAEGYLTGDDLVERSFPYHLAMSYMEAFGGTESQLPDNQKRIEGSWISTAIPQETVLVECILEVSTENEKLILVEEIQSCYAGMTADQLVDLPPTRKARHRKSIQRCRGFAALSAKNRLCMFLIGDDYPDANHIIFAVAFESAEPDNQVVDRMHCFDYAGAEIISPSPAGDAELFSSSQDNDYDVLEDDNYKSDDDSDVVFVQLNERVIIPGAKVAEILREGRRVFERRA